MKHKTLNSRQLIPIFLFLNIAIISFRCSTKEGLSPEEFSQIQQNFITPNNTNTVWCYYYWINDDISKDGVTKDLEAMKKFGIGAVLTGNINPAFKDGRVPLFSDEWWDITVHLVNEGKRLGIDIGFFNCPGWSQSGGPWVSYDKAMRHLVYSETNVEGPKKIRKVLDRPANEFQDTYVLAFNTIEAEKMKPDNSNTRVSSIPAVKNCRKWFDGNLSSSALFEISDTAKYTINITTEKDIHTRSLILYPAEPEFKCNVELRAKTDSGYVTLNAFLFDRSNTKVIVGPVTHGPVAISVPVTEASEFQLIISNLRSNEKEAGFSEIILTEAQILERYIEKTLGKMHPTPLPLFDTYMWEPQNDPDKERLIIKDVVNLSVNMDKDGMLTWDAPEGNWTILRMGMTPTGTKNSPAAPQGTGYEIDKANAELARFHFENYMLEIIKRVPKENLPALKYVIADSYEMGSQNWTDNFTNRFKDKYGYCPVKYLPVFSGRIVGNVNESERFLWDLRRAVADDVAYEYVGGLRMVCNEHNLKLWLENYGHWGFPSEFLMYGGQSDMVGGEYWNEGDLGNYECKSASSAAHIYGKPLVTAESFTSAHQSFKRHPALLKKRGDWSMTEGINHFSLHLYIQQPDDERIPGINAWFGTEFNRHNTWFDQGKAWVEYLRRCQHLLQQGKYVADVCYFIGEDAPKMTGICKPELPDGYSYDYINAEVILNRLSVKDGRLMLPDGMNYGLLVLPQINTMRPEVLLKIEELVKQGAIVLGPRPDRSPSLQNYPYCDEEVKKIASRLWMDDYQDGKLIHRYGKGSLLDGLDIGEAMDIAGISKDVEMDPDVPILWTHRSLPGMEIYFMTNQGNTEVHIQPSFRVTGLKPQLWDAITGEIRQLNEFSIKDKRVILPLDFKPLQSWFIIFTNRVNDETDEGYHENFPEPDTILSLNDVWSVDFENKDIGPSEPLVLAALTDWVNSDNERIRYYSGKAVYRTIFTMDKLPEKGKCYINLGNVGVMARVELNGKSLGTTWIAPFRVATGDNLKEGQNILEVEVVNTWRNQLIKDAGLPQDKKYTWTIESDAKPGEDLQSSGLTGSVIIEWIKK